MKILDMDWKGQKWKHSLAHPLNELVKAFIPIANPRVDIVAFPRLTLFTNSKDHDTADQMTEPSVCFFEASCLQGCGAYDKGRMLPVLLHLSRQMGCVDMISIKIWIIPFLADINKQWTWFENFRSSCWLCIYCIHWVFACLPRPLNNAVSTVHTVTNQISYPPSSFAGAGL